MGPQEVLAESRKPTFLPTEPSLPSVSLGSPAFPLGRRPHVWAEPPLSSDSTPRHQLRLWRGLTLTGGSRLWGPTFLGCRRGAVLPSAHPAHVREQELAGQALAGLWGREGHCDAPPHGRRRPAIPPVRPRRRRSWRVCLVTWAGRGPERPSWRRGNPHAGSTSLTGKADGRD